MPAEAYRGVIWVCDGIVLTVPPQVPEVANGSVACADGSLGEVPEGRGQAYCGAFPAGGGTAGSAGSVPVGEVALKGRVVNGAAEGAEGGGVGAGSPVPVEVGLW